MDELIYQFLLQAGYPRAAIVADATLLAPEGRIPDDATTFVVVDPDTAARLAVIEVVDAIDAEALSKVASTVGSYADRLGGLDIQGFIVRVDARGRRDSEQVQFYRTWPNTTMQRVSTKTFPDLDALRVVYKLKLEQRLQASAIELAPEPALPVFEDERHAENGAMLGGSGIVDQTNAAAAPVGGGVARALPALLLMLLFGTDWYLTQVRGIPLLTMTQAILAVGAAALVTASGLVGKFR